MTNKPTFIDTIQRRVVFFDGAMGTEIQNRNLSPSDFGGDELEGANDWLTIAKPALIDEIHRSYFEAGADVVETNTFGSTRLKLDEYGKGDRFAEVNIAAAELARKAADHYSTDDKPRFVAGSMGPTGMLPSSTDPDLGAITPDELEQQYYEQATALIRGGVDILLIETAQDILEVKSAMFGARRAISEAGRPVYLQTQVTLLDASGRMLLGTDIGSAMTTISAIGTDILGLNCSTGPHEMTDAVRYLGDMSGVPVSIIPNAGMPINDEGETVYPMGPDEMAEALARFVREFGVQVVGGCCGTTPDHIRRFVDSVGDIPISTRSDTSNGAYVSSAMTSVPLMQEPRPMLIGERVNTVGSRKVKELLLNDQYEGLVPIARGQVEGGAHVLDICTALTEREDEIDQMRSVVKLLSQSVPAPLVIDSTEADVIEEALKHLPGVGIVNSINLEGDGSRVHTVLPIVKKYGAAVIALTIDEEGMAHTADRKLEIARRIHDIATREYGISPDRLIFDCLTFPLTTGQEELRNGAVETMNGISRVKAEMPGVLTVLGVSNVSFGVNQQSRGVLNSAFLHHCVEAGLDAAIVNPAHITPYASIPEEDRRITNALIYNETPDALADFIQHFESRSVEQEEKEDPRENMTLLQIIHYNVVNRDPEGIEDLIDELRNEMSAVAIINDVLLPAMQEVGDKFGTGELILPFVLESAGVMKRAVAHTEQFLEKNDETRKGDVVVATVYGDVHDIGKNLVRTIFSNNGYTVHDLGKQVPVSTIIDKAKEVGATAIGLSALLVSTSKQMGYVVDELNNQKLDFPVIIGGAAINRNFARRISFMGAEEKSLANSYAGGVFYANDAFEGLRKLNDLALSESREQTVHTERQDAVDYYNKEYVRKAEQQKVEQVASPLVRATVPPAPDIPTAPFSGTRTFEDIPVSELWSLLDRRELFKLNWGVRATDGKEYDQLIEDEFAPLLLDLQSEVEESGWLHPRLVYGYYPCRSDKETLYVYDPSNPTTILQELVFPRQHDRDHLALPDYWQSVESGDMDTIAFQVVTVGDEVNSVTEEMNARGEYSRALYLHGLAVQAAEALAEYNHRRIRREWGIEPNRGLRFSYGYPACPEMSEQAKMFALLKPESAIGVTQTEAFQMVPEASTAALIGHHPAMKYFNA
jgi:5-methyltetrahydrofolate--homocysteine methyltransferase